MKTLLLVLSVLFLVIGMGAYALAGMIDAKDSTEIAEAVALLGEEGVNAAFDGEAPSTGRIDGGMMLAFLAIILCLVTIIITFAKPSALKVFLIIITVVAILTIVVHPAIDKGEYGGQSGQVISIVAGIFAVVGTAAAFFAKKPATAA